jgi:hypothetical protein
MAGKLVQAGSERITSACTTPPNTLAIQSPRGHLSRLDGLPCSGFKDDNFAALR